MSGALARSSVLMTVNEFLSWDPGDGSAYQLIDGQPWAMAPAGVPHGSLQSELARLLGNHLLEHRPDCLAVTAPGIIPSMFSAHNMRVPDLAVSCSPQTDDRVMTDPLLVIEILSPGNQAKTWANVWAYTTIPSVREVLVLRTDEIAAHLLRRAPGGAWPLEPERIADGDLVLGSVGFKAPLAALYRTTRLARPAS